MFNQKELNELMIKINLTQFKEEVKKSNAGRKEVDCFNPFFESFREITDYEDLSPWVDDVLRGAGMLNEGKGTNHTTPLMLFHLLKTLPFYTTGEIKNHINRKRSVLGQHVMKSDSYPRWLRSILSSAIKSLSYHIERGNKLTRDVKEGEEIFSFTSDKKGWEEQKARCEALGVPVTTNLDNPLGDLPIEERKLLAGLTVEEINGIHRTSYTTGEIDPDSLNFKKDSDKKEKIHKISKKQFQIEKKHQSSYFSVPATKLPEMIDLDTGEIITYQIKETK